MSAQNFATRAASVPNPQVVNHPISVGYTCHMAVMHWAFMDRGDPEADAAARVAATAHSKCHACAAGGAVHVSIPSNWYGSKFCAGAVKIADRAALYPWVSVGDVLVTGSPSAPIHSMVVVGKRSLAGHRYVYIRGFNNHGTLGTGLHNGYDNANQDIDRARYWRVRGAGEVFGQAPGGETLWRIPYNTFTVNANIIRNNCRKQAGVWTYHGQ